MNMNEQTEAAAFRGGRTEPMDPLKNPVEPSRMPVTFPVLVRVVAWPGGHDGVSLTIRHPGTNSQPESINLIRSAAQHGAIRLEQPVLVQNALLEWPADCTLRMVRFDDPRYDIVLRKQDEEAVQRWNTGQLHHCPGCGVRRVMLPGETCPFCLCSSQRMPMTKQDFDPSSFDAWEWAEEFARVIKHHPLVPHDKDTMTTWFANAIMAGHDHVLENIRREVNTRHDGKCHDSPRETLAQLENHPGPTAIAAAAWYLEKIPGMKDVSPSGEPPGAGIVDRTIAERGAVYGDPSRSCANIGLEWTGLLQQHYGVRLDHPVPAWLVSLMMAVLKAHRAARVFHADNYVDGHAYLKMAEHDQREVVS